MIGLYLRRAACFLLIFFGVTFIFLPYTTLALGDDADKAREKLDDEYIPFTPEKFFHYIFMNNVEVVELFLEGGIPLDATNSLGRGALHVAAGKEDGKILGLLIKRGADVNQVDKRGTTPLCIAAADGHLDNVRLLLQKNADIDAQCGVDRNSPLHIAALNGHGSITKTLIETGAALEPRNRMADTPLHAAIRSNNTILQMLLEEGADVEAKNRSGGTPLHSAVARQKATMVNTLLAAGAPLEAKNSRGATPLWLAANIDAAEIAQILLNAGANPEAKAADGMSPLQIAKNARAALVIEILRNALGK